MSDYSTGNPVINDSVEAEQRFFLSVLADHLNNRKTPETEPLNWAAMLLLARSHQVEAIIFQQCKHFISAETAAWLSSAYASTLFFYSNRVALSKSIQRQFDAAGIPFYSVKGLDIAKHYPRPALRTMGDLDILIHSEDKQKAHEAMLALGFEDVRTNEFEMTYRKNQLEFELHDSLLYDNSVNTQAGKDYCAQAWSHTTPLPDTSRRELDWNFHFVYLLLHLRKHFLVSGAGFRQFMDLVVVVQHCPLDWDALKQTLSALELLRFATVCLSFCERWFDVKMPLHTDIDEDFYLASTKKIMDNGVFGFDDVSNQSNPAHNTVRKYGKLRALLRQIFPSYRDVCTVPYYSFVNHRAYLLPAVWLYRFYRVVRYRMYSRGRKLVQESLHDELYQQRKELLNQWGL